VSFVTEGNQPSDAAPSAIVLGPWSSWRRIKSAGTVQSFGVSVRYQAVSLLLAVLDLDGVDGEGHHPRAIAIFFTMIIDVFLPVTLGPRRPPRTGASATGPSSLSQSGRVLHQTTDNELTPRIRIAFLPQPCLTECNDLAIATVNDVTGEQPLLYGGVQSAV